MTTLLAPSVFVPAPDGMRSGLPARYTIAQSLIERDRYLWASQKHQHCCWLADDSTNGIYASVATSSNPLQFWLRVPPYTQWAAWRVLADKSGSVEAQRVGSSLTHKIITAKRHGVHTIEQANWFASTEFNLTDSGTPSAIDVSNMTGAWADVLVNVWITASSNVEVWAVDFEFLRPRGTSGDAITA